MPSLISTFLSRSPGRYERAPENAVAAATIGGEFVRTPDEYDVYIESTPGSNFFQLAPQEIDWESIHLGLDEAGSQANLVVRGLDAAKLTSPGKLGSAHLKHLLEKINPDSRILIARGRGAGQLYVIFSGYVVAGTATWSEKHQGITWSAVSEGEERVKTRQAAQIVGRIMRKYPFRDPGEYSNNTNFDLIEVDVLPPAFNAAGKPNMLNQTLLLPNTQGMRVFCGDGDKGAKAWHLANALRYVAAFYASYADIDVGPFMLDTNEFIELDAGGTSTDPFRNRMLQKVENVSIASMSAFDALAALCQAGGLHFEIARRLGTPGHSPNFYLRVLAPLSGPADNRFTRSRNMISPEVRDIPRDAPFSNYTGFAPADIAVRNAAQTALLSADDRVINAPVVVGGALDLECTLLLRPGWKPFTHLDLDPDNPPPVPPPAGGWPDALAQAAMTFWENEFGSEDDDEEREASGVPKSRYHTQHPDHHEVADIGRLWIFPDTDRYMKTADLTESDYKRKHTPWNRAELYSPYGFDADHQRLVYTDFVHGGGLPTAIVADWVLRRRPFGNILSRPSLQVADWAPRVQMNFTHKTIAEAMAYVPPHGASKWIDFTGSVVIDPDRAAIWIKEDNLLLSPKLTFENKRGEEFSYLKSLIGLDAEDKYVGPHLFVRITCTVRGDQRLAVRPTQTGNVLSRERSQVIDLGYDQFKATSRIRGNSIYIDIPESDDNYKDRDDLPRLIEYAATRQAMLDRLTVGGDWETNSIETGVRLGDSFRGVEGLGLAFATWPSCTSIVWSKDPDAGYRTVFHLDDLRHAPDVGSE